MSGSWDETARVARSGIDRLMVSNSEGRVLIDAESPEFRLLMKTHYEMQRALSAHERPDRALVLQMAATIVTSVPAMDYDYAGEVKLALAYAREIIRQHDDEVTPCRK